MKTVRLNGEYSYSSQVPCDFEDIPVFIKMASGATGSCDEVTVSNVNIGALVVGPSTIQAWRIVKDQYGNLVLGIRPSSKSLKLPCVYQVVTRKSTKEPVLVNLNLPAYERLRLFYEVYVLEEDWTLKRTQAGIITPAWVLFVFKQIS